MENPAFPKKGHGIASGQRVRDLSHSQTHQKQVKSGRFGFQGKEREVSCPNPEKPTHCHRAALPQPSLKRELKDTAVLAD